MMLKRWGLLLVVALMAAAVWLVGAQEFPDCEIGYRDLELEQSQRVRNRNDRIEDLVEIMDEFQDGEDVFALHSDLREWAVFADSAWQRFKVDMPPCSEYQAMMDTYWEVLVDVYRVSAQVGFIIENADRGGVPEHVTDMFADTVQSITIGVGIWEFFYEDFGHRS